MKKNEKMESIADFLFEAGMLAKTPRSGFYFLGSGEQSVAEHINRVCYAGYVLSQIAGDVDEAKVLKMCLFHDFAETRVSDLNYVHQKYTSRHEHKAIEDLAAGLSFGKDIKDTIEVYEERKSKEALLAKDADNIEFILALKEQCDIGNERAQSWINAAIKRLKTEEGKILADKIIQTDSDRWWFGDKDDEWWVSRNK
jgi:putative hydrolase of HD superfamily